MDKISLKNLVPEVSISDSKKNTLDINSLVIIKNSYEDTIKNFSPQYLIKSSKEKREQVLKIYNKYYGSCLEKIKLFHNSGKTDMIYSVPENISENIIPKYCMDFIEHKLKQHRLDTLRMTETTIFITWKYIESNIR